METRVKKREWVKNAAIILLAGLLILTFFSNTIMNRNLPEVATQYVTDGSINAKVRGTGTVTANGTHIVKAEQTREIRAVMVKTGQTVETGDVLFVLGSGEGSELETAQEELRQLQLNYQRTALGGSYTDYTADEIRVAAAWDAYIRADSELNSMDPLGNKDSDAYRYLQKQLEKATAERDAAKEAYDTMLADSQAALSAAESQRLAAEQAVLLAEGWNADQLEYWQQDYLDHPEKRVRELEGESVPFSPTAESEDESEGTLSPAVDTGDEADDETVTAPVTEPADDGEKLEKWKQLLESTETVKDAQAALNAVSQAKADAAQKTVDEIEEAMSVYNTTPEYQAAQAARDEAYLTYLEAQSSLAARQNADAKSSASLGLELGEISRQIEEKKKQIEELSGGEENQIVARVSGTVQSVDCMAGDTVMKDSPLCSIEVPDMGYTLSFSVTSDQAARLRIGDSATVSNYYWGRQIVATLENIRIDPKNPQTNKLLTFEITGDVTAGAELTISVGQRSANYDSVVPKSAVHNDSNGSFVLKVEAKSSPLGNRYLARRVNVEILAQDDSNIAVSGDLGWGDYVITTSSAPLSNGDLVRLAD